MTDLNSFQSINLSRFFDSVKFRSGSGSEYHLVIDFCIVMFYMLMILMKFSFVRKLFSEFFFLGSGSGSWVGSGFHYEIHWRKLFFTCWRYLPNLVSLRKVFVKIKYRKLVYQISSYPFSANSQYYTNCTMKFLMFQYFQLIFFFFFHFTT